MKIIKILIGDSLYSLLKFVKNKDEEFKEDVLVKELKEDSFFENILNSRGYPSILSVMIFISIVFYLTFYLSYRL